MNRYASAKLNEEGFARVDTIEKEFLRHEELMMHVAGPEADPRNVALFRTAMEEACNRLTKAVSMIPRLQAPPPPFPDA